MMMSRKESSAWAKSRVLLAAPIIVLLLLCFGIQANSQENGSQKATITIDGMLFNQDADETTEFVRVNSDGSFSVLQDSVAFELSGDGQTVVFHSKDNSQTASMSLEDNSLVLDSPQDDKKQKVPQNDEEIFVIVDVVPQYPGGDEARLKFLREHLRYPDESRKNGIQGTVYVSFVVEKDGSVNDVKIARGIDKFCDEECIRVTKLMPKWTPGIQKGKVVRVSYNMPIKFTLATTEEE